MRAIMSLPVPLSPWIRTGTLALATLSMRSRSDCMTSERPKITASGGNSPSEVASEVTEGIVVMSDQVAPWPVGTRLDVHPKSQTEPSSALGLQNIFNLFVFIELQDSGTSGS